MTGYQSKKGMARDKLAQPAQEPVREALKLALEALLNSVDLVVEDAYNAEQLYGNYPTRQGKVGGLKVLAEQHKQAITAIKEALAQPAQAEVLAQAVPDETLTIVYQSGYYDGKKAALAGREWNFCERCGKRTADLTTIHTCTPPQENT